MKILTVVGARPQFIKAAVVSREFRSRKDIHEIMVHTGQHYDKKMSDVFFKDLGIPSPDYNLSINQLSHARMTAKMMISLERVALSIKPDVLLVYGDTNSTLAASLVASKLSIPLAHVEAGVRSFNKNNPEEVNRLITDRLANILYCPVKKAVKNLSDEGIDNAVADVVFSGDVMLDALIYHNESSLPDLSSLPIDSAKPFVLCTIHREENIKDEERFLSIMRGLDLIGKEINVLFPIHPRTEKLVKKLNKKWSLKFIEPLSYFEMLTAVRHSEMVITDSGGLQKEAYFFGKPCMTVRKETEWIDLIELGANRLVEADSSKMFEEFSALRTIKFDVNIELFGGGKAACKIVDHLSQI